MFRAVRNLAAFSTHSFNHNKNYYKILNVDELATPEIIKTSYKTLAKKYHPDVNKGKQELFKEVNEAYQVLSDPNAKREYDQARSYATSPNHNNSNASSTYDPRYPTRDPWRNPTYQQHHYYNPYRTHQSARMHNWTSKDQQLYEFYKKQQADYTARYYQTQRQKFERGYRSPIQEEYMRRFMEEVARNKQQQQELREQRQAYIRSQEYRIQKQYQQSKKKMKEATQQMLKQIGNIAKGLWNAYLQTKRKK